MDWIKVKTKHVLYEGMNEKIGWAWIKAMALAAQIEGMPTEEQFKKIMHYKTLISLQRYFNDRSTTLQCILNKVLKDVQYTLNMRERGKQKMALWREKNKSVTSNVTPKDKIRLDKNRLDKNNNNNTPGCHLSLLTSEQEPILKEITTHYQNYIGSLSATAVEDIKAFLPDIPKEYFIEAINVACDQEHRKWAYVRKVIQNWKELGRIDKGQRSGNSSDTQKRLLAIYAQEKQEKEGK